ncbi:hypothetical protein H0N99_04780 [Candidatus Micrarchaeota archaeon]|nr:hypothetical protein [Candidatus Micrarchaeota archaeon]
MRIEDPRKIELRSLELVEHLKDILKNVDFMVIGGWCTTAYAGNIRLTTDVDMACRPFSHGQVMDSFDRKEFNVKRSGFGVRAKHNETGIEVHIDAGNKVHDGSTNTDIKIPDFIFDKPSIGRITGILNRSKSVEIPVCDLEFFMVLKAVPNVPKHDYDFAVLLTQPLHLRELSVEYSPGRFAELLRSSVKNITPFREKEKRLRDRKYFRGLGNALANPQLPCAG